MANALGYQKREEGEGAFDIGGAARTQAGKIQIAQKLEQQKRDKLTSEYDESIRKIKSTEAKSKGFNNWMQEQITKVTKQKYDDFQALKKNKGRNDNEYRRKNTNMDASWQALATRAQDWNKHYETGLNTIASGKGSDFMAAMLEEDSKIGDFSDLDMIIDADGNMELQGTRAGGLVTKSLTSILAPENSYDEAIDVSKSLNKMVGDLPKTKVKQADGTYLESQSEHPDFNGQRLLNVDANTSNPREVAGWYSGLYDHKPTYVTSEANRMKTVADYMVSDLGKMAIQAKTQELIAANTGNAAYTPAQAALDAEMAIRGEQQMLAISFAEVKGINTPQFQGHAFKIPAGGEPMTITYDEIDPISGDVKSVTKTFNPGDEVNIGDMQHKRVRADLYKKQSSMVDHIQTGGKAGKTTKTLNPSQIAQNKSDTAFYTTVADAAQWDTKGYLASSGGKFTDIQRSHNGLEGEDLVWSMKIYGPDKKGNPNTLLESIDYPVKKDANGVILDANGEPELDVKAMEEILADKLEGGKAKAGTGRFRKGKTAYGTTPYGVTPGSPKESYRYYPVGSGAQGGLDADVLESDGSYKSGMFIGPNKLVHEAGMGSDFHTRIKNPKTKIIEDRSKDSNEIMAIISKGKGGTDIWKDATQQETKNKQVSAYLRGFGSIPDKAITTKTEIQPSPGVGDVTIASIGSPYTIVNSKGKRVPAAGVQIPIRSGNNITSEAVKTNKELMELGMKYYHARTKKKRAAIAKSINAKSPCVFPNPDYDENVKGSQKLAKRMVGGIMSPCTP